MDLSSFKFGIVHSKVLGFPLSKYTELVKNLDKLVRLYNGDKGLSLLVPAG
jgi:hypothetical protein